MPGTPISSTVGMSGAANQRDLAMTARALIWPARTCGSEFDDMSHIMSTCPATRSCMAGAPPDRKSTRLNSSHITISYAVFCLKKKKKTHQTEYHKKKQKQNRTT